MHTLCLESRCGLWLETRWVAFFGALLLTLAVAAGVLFAGASESPSAAQISPVASLPSEPPPPVETDFSALAADEERQAQAGQGARTYRQSCVHCHGIHPAGLAYEDPLRFRRAVLEGRGEMPALGFKLTAAEVEGVRRYLARCAAEAQAC
jgi:mono/diheme cytochrome c family protein